MKTFTAAFMCLLVTVCVATAQTGLLQPGAFVRLRFGLDTEMKQLYKVDAQGAFEVTSVGKFSVAGMSPEQAISLISQRYAAVMHTDVSTIRVTLNILEPSVEVTGKVNTPVVLPYTDDLAMLKALAAAGGLQGSVKQSQVQIIRVPKERIIVNLARIMQHPELDFTLFPGDKVEVQ